MDGNSARLNKTVVILTPGFPSVESDTTCIPALQEYVVALHKTYPELKIFVLAFQYPFKEGWYKWNGIEVFSANGKDSKYFSRINTWLKIFHQLKRIYQNHGTDVLHSFWLSEASLIAQQFGGSRRIPHIATLFGQDALPSNKYLWLLNYKKMTIVANSEFTSKTFYKSTYRHPDQIIHFGLAAEKMHHSPLDERTCDIIGVGSLIQIKNYELFIEIVREVKNTFPKLKVLLLGGGPQKKRIEELIEQHDLQNTIELKGALPRKEVFTYLRQSKILLHTSRYESAGYVFLESLYCGCEIVCFDIGFVPQSSKSHICNEKIEMIEKLKLLLEQNLVHEPVQVPTMNETVQKFATLYSQA
jgi:1,2-diacylglycerol 3-alpha-glucosyltransferase